MERGAVDLSGGGSHTLRRKSLQLGLDGAVVLEFQYGFAYGIELVERTGRLGVGRAS
jgi:hypothetical protein